MADLSFLLSPQDRQKLSRQVGITLDDGRKFRGGVMVSAQDAANTAATGARDAAFSAQTGQYATQGGVNPNKAGAQAYSAYMGQTPVGQMAAKSAAGGMNPAPAPAQMGATPQPSPYEDMLNRARLTQQSFQAVGGAQQASVAAPAPYNPDAVASFKLPDGSTRQFGGVGPVQGQPPQPFPAAQGFGNPEMPASQAQQTAFTAQTQPAPTPDLLRPRTTAEIAKMTPQQRAGLVQFGQEQKQQALAGRQAEAEISKTQAQSNRQPDLSFQEQNVQAQIQAEQEKLGRALTTAERAKVFDQVATSASPTGNPNAKLQADSVKARMEEERALYKNSIASASFAKQAEQAIAAGAKTGTFAGLVGRLKTLGESIGAGDFGASEQSIAQKGLAGLQATGVRAIMQGLGSMSNADREFATSSLPTITDPKQSIQFYVELSKENERLAKEDAALIRKLERENVDQAEIYRRIDEAREARNVAESVYAKVTGQNPSAAPASPQAPQQNQPSRPSSPSQFAGAAQRIRNPQTGEIRELQNGQWVPVK